MEEKIKHIQATFMASIRHFERQSELINSEKLTIKCGEYKGEPELLMDADFRDVPVRDFFDLWSSLSGMIRSYDKLNNRNRKKDDIHLNKHAMHLIRLYMMCLDILEKGEINTYREKEHDLLMGIRNGHYQKEDGTFHNSFFEMVSDFEAKVKRAFEKSSLPEKPNYKKINDFVTSVNERIVKGEINRYAAPELR